MTMAPSQLGAFAKSDPSQATPNLQFHVQPISLDRFGDPPHTFPAFTASVCNLRPTSRGHVRITSADPRAYPAIAPNYLSTDEDRQIAVAALRLTRRIVTGTEAMKKHEPEEFMPGPAFQSDDELLEGGRQHRHDDLPPGGHVQDGPRRAIRSAVVDHAVQGARHRAPARDRRLDHADDHVRQHELADGDDRGAGGGHRAPDEKA